jgi:hypothetical protein
MVAYLRGAKADDTMLGGAENVVTTLSPQNVQFSLTVPARRCVCSAPTPAAPEPKRNRAQEQRHDFGRSVATDRLQFRNESQPLAAPIAASAAPPDESGLYLRTSRLLI